MKRFSFFLILGLLPCLASSSVRLIQESPGPLSQAHSFLEGIEYCNQCHTPDHKSQENKCLACHSEIAERISQNRGYHKDKTEDCTSCHLEHQNLNWKLTGMDITEFDHDETGYPLKFAHSNIKDCLACHRQEISYPREKSRSLLLMQSGCKSCHPSPHPGRQENCRVCHDARSWKVDIWNKRGFL